MSQPPRLAFSISDACAACGLGRTTIYAAIRAGELQVCKIGRRTLITEAALRDWLTLSQHLSTDAGVNQRVDERSRSRKV